MFCHRICKYRATFHFLSVTRKKTETKERVRKRPELGGRDTNSSNHSKNSLRSDSFSCRLACLAYAIQESKKIPIIVHPINTSSCGMFFGITFFFSSFYAFHWDKSLELLTLENILRQAKRHSRNHTSCFMSPHSRCSFENIPHEEVFRGMQIL